MRVANRAAGPCLHDFTVWNRKSCQGSRVQWLPRGRKQKDVPLGLWEPRLTCLCNRAAVVKCVPFRQMHPKALQDASAPFPTEDVYPKYSIETEGTSAANRVTRVPKSEHHTLLRTACCFHCWAHYSKSSYLATTSAEEEDEESEIRECTCIRHKRVAGQSEVSIWARLRKGLDWISWTEVLAPRIYCCSAAVHGLNVSPSHAEHN